VGGRGTALDTGQSLIKLHHFPSHFLVFPHPAFDPCSNLGNSRVADTPEIPAYFYVRKRCVLPGRTDSVPWTKDTVDDAALCPSQRGKSSIFR